LGEIQLGAILEQILSPEQYATNVITVAGSRDPVEYAVKLPGDGEHTVWLPIDAKFPGETYAALVEARESADPARVEQASKELERRIKGCAKDIRDKYIGPPDTTDFAIMFLPFEGLYAEVVNLGLVETLSRDYKVNIAGPTTMAALLNSLQMGFKTLAIQKRSAEVWRVLGAVKSEFGKFSACLEKVQERIQAADREVQHLITTRTNVMNRSLRSVEQLDSATSERLLGLPEGEEES
jgi:DNA recombination protein RmuC